MADVLQKRGAKKTKKIEPLYDKEKNVGNPIYWAKRKGVIAFRRAMKDAGIALTDKITESAFDKAYEAYLKVKIKPAQFPTHPDKGHARNQKDNAAFYAECEKKAKEEAAKAKKPEPEPVKEGGK